MCVCQCSVHASACMCMHAFIMTSQGINQNMLSQYFFILVKGHWAKQLNAPLTISVVAGTGKSADWVTPGLTVSVACLLVYHNLFYTRLAANSGTRMSLILYYAENLLRINPKTRSQIFIIFGSTFKPPSSMSLYSVCIIFCCFPVEIPQKYISDLKSQGHKASFIYTKTNK